MTNSQNSQICKNHPDYTGIEEPFDCDCCRQIWISSTHEGRLDFQYEIVNDLRRISRKMQLVGGEMVFYGGFGKMGGRGRELIGASKITEGLADRIEKELLNGNKKTPPKKHKQSSKTTKTRGRTILPKQGGRPKKPRVLYVPSVP